jgi:hypothetical protein
MRVYGNVAVEGDADVHQAFHPGIGRGMDFPGPKSKRLVGESALGPAAAQLFIGIYLAEWLDQPARNGCSSTQRLLAFVAGAKQCDKRHRSGAVLTLMIYGCDALPACHFDTASTLTYRYTTRRDRSQNRRAPHYASSRSNSETVPEH